MPTVQFLSWNPARAVLWFFLPPLQKWIVASWRYKWTLHILSMMALAMVWWYYGILCRWYHMWQICSELHLFSFIINKFSFIIVLGTGCILVPVLSEFRLPSRRNSAYPRRIYTGHVHVRKFYWSVLLVGPTGRFYWSVLLVGLIAILGSMGAQGMVGYL